MILSTKNRAAETGEFVNTDQFKKMGPYTREVAGRDSSGKILQFTPVNFEARISSSKILNLTLRNLEGGIRRPNKKLQLTLVIFETRFGSSAVFSRASVRACKQGS